MDRNQIIYGDRTIDAYEKEVENFIEFAFKNTNFVYCPCKDCKKFVVFDDPDTIRDHLYRRGFDHAYKIWRWHGETESSLNQEKYVAHEDDAIENDRSDDMVEDVVGNFANKPEVLASLLSDSEKPLYTGCTRYTRLSGVLKLYNLKAANGWTDTSFTALLKLLKDILPEGNELPDHIYEVKNILCPMDMEYKEIHACPNNCILYRNEYENSLFCPKCKASRYKKKQICGDVEDHSDAKKKSPAKVLWYLPVIPRFKRLFANSEDAKNLTWHADQHTPLDDKKIRHPVDSDQWKKIDVMYPSFSRDARNLRLGLCMNGINPCGSLSNTDSFWPVMLVIYNLPPYLCTKNKFILMSLMISGPQHPGKDVDVYLAPLIEDLKKLWDDGEMVLDAHRQENFTLRIMVFCTINDFSAYGYLSGFVVEGHRACPICEESTDYCQLWHGNKTVYLGYRRFLPDSHPYRRMKRLFNREQEFRKAPDPLNGEEVHARVKNINVEFGKHTKSRTNDMSCWNKSSIFFDLPYWESLDVRHCLDVMQIEKTICDSLLGTLLHIPGKTKDGYETRLDMVDLSIRANLAPELRGQRTYLPSACYTLSQKEKQNLCLSLQSMKVPSMYSSNITRLVSMRDLKLVGLKSHDYHVLMEQLLSVAIRSILPNHVRYSIIRLCLFFNAICSEIVDRERLDELQNEIVLVLCQLEMYFSPTFFDIMVHLIVHLVREIKICGPVYLRWMCPFNRYMKDFKEYAKNRHHPDARIVEGYIANEVIQFCTNAIGQPKTCNEGMIKGKGTQAGKLLVPSGDELRNAHLYVLLNSEEVQPYVTTHMSQIRESHCTWTDKDVLNEHNRSFVKWFSDAILEQPVSETLRWLAFKPNHIVMSYSGYNINGYSFATKKKDDKSTMQNSGVTFVSGGLHKSSSKDKNLVYPNMSHYGVIEDIWELDYVKFKVPVFRCKCVDNNCGV